jgi:formate--tetrahydrofolate ligase
LEHGIHNILRHIENIKEKFGLNVIVAINKFNQDTANEVKFLQDKLLEKDVELSLVEAWGKGGEGATDLAEKVVALCEKMNTFNYLYELNDDIKTKIEKIATNYYGASGVEYLEDVEEKIATIEKLGYSKLPICIAKTQYSFSDDPKNLQCIDPFKIHVKDVILKTGAEFIVILTGSIFTMPGLPKIPASENIDVNSEGNIVGIF